MPELPLAVRLTRDWLGLGELDINDHLDYAVAGGDGNFLGTGVTYQRNLATSPFLDGAVEVSETREMVQEKIVLEVFGETVLDMLDKLKAARQAFTQKFYELKVGRDNGPDVEPTWWLRYACTKADYQLGWTGPRVIAHQVQGVFTVPRQPKPLAGAM